MAKGNRPNASVSGGNKSMPQWANTELDRSAVNTANTWGLDVSEITEGTENQKIYANYLRSQVLNKFDDISKEVDTDFFVPNFGSYYDKEKANQAWQSKAHVQALLIDSMGNAKEKDKLKKRWIEAYAKKDYAWNGQTYRNSHKDETHAKKNAEDAYKTWTTSRFAHYGGSNGLKGSLKNNNAQAVIDAFKDYVGYDGTAYAAYKKAKKG